MKIKTNNDVKLAIETYRNLNPQNRAANEMAMLFKADEAELAKWQTRLVENPANAFEWANDAQHAAARLEILSRVVVTMLEGEMTMEDAIDEVRQDQTERLLRNEFRANSTSLAHNAMNLARAAVVSSFVRKGFLRTA